ncbi:hypothetical protein ABT255_43185, partial [Streptomyces mirabilis]
MTVTLRRAAVRFKVHFHDAIGDHMTPSGAASEITPSGPAWELLVPAASAPARARGRALQAALREAVRTGRL